MSYAILYNLELSTYMHSCGNCVELHDFTLLGDTASGFCNLLINVEKSMPYKSLVYNQRLSWLLLKS